MLRALAAGISVQHRLGADLRRPGPLAPVARRQPVPALEGARKRAHFGIAKPEGKLGHAERGFREQHQRQLAPHLVDQILEPAALLPEPALQRPGRQRKPGRDILEPRIARAQQVDNLVAHRADDAACRGARRDPGKHLRQHRMQDRIAVRHRPLERLGAQQDRIYRLIEAQVAGEGAAVFLGAERARMFEMHLERRPAAPHRLAQDVAEHAKRQFRILPPIQDRAVAQLIVDATDAPGHADAEHAVALMHREGALDAAQRRAECRRGHREIAEQPHRLGAELMSEPQAEALVAGRLHRAVEHVAEVAHRDRARRLVGKPHVETGAGQHPVRVAAIRADELLEPAGDAGEDMRAGHGGRADLVERCQIHGRISPSPKAIRQLHHSPRRRLRSAAGLCRLLSHSVPNCADRRRNARFLPGSSSGAAAIRQKRGAGAAFRPATLWRLAKNLSRQGKFARPCGRILSARAREGRIKELDDERR
ncbi:hypothetical protein SDC9_36507 [bioreactor metagenome]|uniref:Uncharacterized protein n=1 Tax=bioreactor metagenome TaxID=1076179 RepID=A0A644VGU1_9ZZZZ